jgi:putative peptidoglycan lipid II flippase
LPATVGYLMLARPAIGLVLVHGTFNAATGRETAATLALFALGLPAFCLYFLAIRSFQAMQDTRTAFVCYALENGVNILLACLLYRPLGVRGLALAYSAAYSIGALAAVAILRERLGTIGGRRIVYSVGRSVALSAVMAVVIALAAALVGTGTGVVGWLQLLVIVVAGAGAYLGGAGVAASMRGWQTSRRPRR